MIVSSFSTEPKSRYAAQSDYFTVKAEPSRLREKIRPEGKDGCSCLRKAVVKTAPVGQGTPQGGIQADEACKGASAPCGADFREIPAPVRTIKTRARVGEKSPCKIQGKR